MKSFILPLLVLISAISLSGATAADAPHLELYGIWAYGDEVTDSVVLDYKQNNLRFFCGTSEKLPFDSVEYRFKLNGYKDSWEKPFKEGWYFYTDLKPGDYEFEAECRYVNSEIWSPTLRHKFSVSAPWWSSWWALTIYIVLSLGLATWIFFLVRSRIIIHNQLKVEKENHRFRTEFVIHAGREFRTPLTIIHTTIDKLKATGDKLTRTDIQHLRNSSNMLMQMVEQLVEFREIGKGLLYKDKNDVIEMADIPINKNMTVLIIESNVQLADIIKRSILRFMGAIVIADIEEFDAALNNIIPDAIIMDIDLSDGKAYDFLTDLKKNSVTSDIPVILISDFNDSRSIIRAIRSDADDYLPKPFSCEVLTTLVMKRIKMNRKYQDKSSSVQDSAKQLPPIFEKRSDKRFLERLDETIMSSMSNPDFDVNSLAEDLSISRGQLYNKVKILRGMTPVEYLRDMRLTKAASLLSDSNISIKETRYVVGMPDASNFNRRFKYKYGVSPSEYRQD